MKRWVICTIALLITLCGCTRPEPSTPSPSATPVIRICVKAQLHGSVSLQGTTGSVGGALSVTNQSSTPCGIPTVPQITMAASTWHVDTGPAGGATAGYPEWTALATAVPIGTPPPMRGMVLQPGATVVASLMWNNWCEPNGSARTAPLPGNGLRFSVAVPEILVIDDTSGLAPRCNVPGQPTSLGTTAFRDP
jgi:hypothetical protein